MKRLAAKIIITIAIYAALNPVLATTFLSTKSPSFEVDTVYNDDVFISGARIKFNSKVMGDLFSLSYEMVQTDTISGNFMALAYSVQNLGPVLGSYRACARNMSCNADVGRNVLLYGQEINVGPASHIGRDADLAGASIVFQGDCAGNLHVSAQMAVISGRVGGNLFFQGDSLTINPNTVIEGNVEYHSHSRAMIAPGSLVKGQITWKRSEAEKPQENNNGNLWTAITWIVSLRGYFVISALFSVVIIVLTLIPFPGLLALIFLWIILAVSGNIIILLTKSKAMATEKVLEARLFPSMGLGFIIFFLTPVVAMILFFTILAAPLAPILLMLFGIATFAGGIFSSLYVGRRICGIFKQGASNTPGYLCYTTGMTILVVLSAIPIVGYLIVLMAVMAGLGGLVQSYKKHNSEVVPSESV
jgi:hypothetical protein